MEKLKNNFLKRFLFLGFGLMIATVTFANNPTATSDKPVKKAKIPKKCTVKNNDWKADILSKGLPITSFIVEYKDPIDGKWKVVYQEAIVTNSSIIAGKMLGHEVEYRVRAVSKHGVSEPFATFKSENSLEGIMVKSL